MFVLLSVACLLLQAVISVKTELVAVPVTVTDRGGHPMTGLRHEDFLVYEDGRARPIVAFRQGEEPVTLGLIVDRSLSMQPKTPALLAAVSALLESSRPDSELFAVDVNDRVALALRDGRAFTHDPAELRTAAIAYRAEGRTALYDGVIEGLQHLQGGHTNRRVLVVVSDGGDNASRATYAEVLATAHRSDAVIYAIGLLGAASMEDEENAGVLKRLCRDTGGTASFPRTLEEIRAVSIEIARSVREQYTLGFAPPPRGDGPAFRTIKVTVNVEGRGRLRIRTRSGYVVEP
jgi:Ca-activated chloride channel family protein